MRIRFLALLILLLSACTTPVIPDPTEGGDEGNLTSPLSPVQTPDRSSPLPEPSPPLQDAEALFAQLRPLLAESLGTPAEELLLLKAQREEWSSAALGCPQPGREYAQVITPGWRLIVEGADGKRYEVHTAEEPTHFVLCNPDLSPRPSPETPIPEALQPVVEAAKRLVAERRDLPTKALTLVDAEYVEWRNSCLGCAAPGANCLMVITPGYRITLQTGDAVYVVHTDREGDSLVLCEEHGGLQPHPGAEVPDTVWQQQKAVLGFLIGAYPGFGLQQLPPEWVGRSTSRQRGDEVTYHFGNGGWQMELICPPAAALPCAVSLQRAEMGRVWVGEVTADQEVVATEESVELSYEVSACDESVAEPGTSTVEVEGRVGGLLVEGELAYVCCADIALSASRVESTLYLLATNVGEVCRCRCTYPLEAEVRGLEPGQYEVQLWGIQKWGVHPFELLEQRGVVVQ